LRHVGLNGRVTADDGIGAVVWAQVGDGESRIWAFFLPGRSLVQFHGAAGAPASHKIVKLATPAGPCAGCAGV